MRSTDSGPLRDAIYAAKSPGAHARAVTAYRANLETAFPMAAAYRTGGVLFAGVGLFMVALSMLGDWQEVPGAGIGYWLSIPLSAAGGIMSGRSSRIMRRAIAGVPVCPS